MPFQLKTTTLSGEDAREAASMLSRNILGVFSYHQGRDGYYNLVMTSTVLELPVSQNTKPISELLERVNQVFIAAHEKIRIQSIERVSREPIGYITNTFVSTSWRTIFQVEFEEEQEPPEGLIDFMQKYYPFHRMHLCYRPDFFELRVEGIAAFTLIELLGWFTKIQALLKNRGHDLKNIICDCSQLEDKSHLKDPTVVFSSTQMFTPTFDPIFCSPDNKFNYGQSKGTSPNKAMRALMKIRAQYNCKLFEEKDPLSKQITLVKFIPMNLKYETKQSQGDQKKPKSESKERSKKPQMSLEDLRKLKLKELEDYGDLPELIDEGVPKAAGEAVPLKQLKM